MWSSSVLTSILVAPTRSTSTGTATSTSALGSILVGVPVSGFMKRAPVFSFTSTAVPSAYLMCMVFTVVGNLL